MIKLIVVIILVKLLSSNHNYFKLRPPHTILRKKKIIIFTIIKYHKKCTFNVVFKFNLTFYLVKTFFFSFCHFKVILNVDTLHKGSA